MATTEYAMISIVRTNAEDLDFKALVKSLDADLADRDGADHAFYDQFNKISDIKHAIVVYDHKTAVCCGAIKEFEPLAMEIKRMYTSPAHRGKGFATLVLAELEQWARELGYQRCVLETGKRQPEAIKLYNKNGYKSIPNYGQYAKVENSLCFEKLLISLK